MWLYIHGSPLPVETVEGGTRTRAKRKKRRVKRGISCVVETTSTTAVGTLYQYMWVKATKDDYLYIPTLANM